MEKTGPVDKQDSKTISVESGCRYYVRTQAETHFHPLYFLLTVFLPVSAFPVIDLIFPSNSLRKRERFPELRETLYQPSEQEEIAVPISSNGLAMSCARNNS